MGYHQRQLFLSHLAPTSDIPIGLEIDRAEGCYMYSPDGKRYLDLISGIAVSTLGHCHPVVVRAIEEQVRKYMHLMVYGEYVQSPQVRLAELLIENLPSNLNCVYFTNSGTEATEGAMKLAKRFTGRTEIAACRNAYHGSTQGSLSLAGSEELKNAFRPLIPGIRHIEFDDRSALSEITEKTAAFFIEPIQGEAGAKVPSADYLQAVRERCSETGTLLVFDEIQTGMGRTGKLWAFEHWNVIPDTLLLGKAFGGGMPLGAFIAAKDMMSALSRNPVLGHITTFGGHPVACAAAYASMKELLSSGLIEKVAEKEKLFKQYLGEKLHGKGLLLALELDSFEKVQKTIKGCLEKGIVTDWFLFNSSRLRIAPPLIISKEEIKEGCEIISGR